MIVTSEDVKEAISNKLLRTFPKVDVYKEAVSDETYPNFFITLIEIGVEVQRKNWQILTYAFDVRYRNVNDPTTDSKLQENLDKIGFVLLQVFDIIPFESSKIRIHDKRLEIVDGVLHFLFNVRLYVVKFDENEDNGEIMSEIKVDFV